MTTIDPNDTKVEAVSDRDFIDNTPTTSSIAFYSLRTRPPYVRHNKNNEIVIVKGFTDISLSDGHNTMFLSGVNESMIKTLKELTNKLETSVNTHNTIQQVLETKYDAKLYDPEGYFVDVDDL